MGLSAGDRLGRYEILEPLGAGGMGEVYRARDTELDRDVAIKVLPAEVAQNADRLERFEREAKAVARLAHPNILEIWDFGREGEITYAVTELLEGETLRQRLERGPIAWRNSTEIGAAIADGLAAAHGKGIIHRDLKPENIFITSDGRVKILDFGLAQIKQPLDVEADTATLTPAGTAPGTVMGTVGYMSPEQVRGKPADERSDIFALGCILHEMLTSQKAFARDSTADTQAAILKEEPTQLGESGVALPAELQRTIHRCLEKSPDARFQSAADLAYNLRSISTNQSASMVKPAGVPEATKRTRTHWTVAAAVLFGVAAIAFVIALKPGDVRDRLLGERDSDAIESIAVLPFVNAGADPDTEYLSDGISESLINNLARLPGLKVISSSTVFRWKGKEPDAQAVGRQLGVRAVLTGRILQRGDSISISVELVDTRDNTNIWGERYSRSLRDLIALENEISRSITQKLRIELTSEDERLLTQRFTQSSEAYRLYLRGRHHVNRLTVNDINKAIQYFEQAIEREPNYAAAHAGLADSYSLLETDAGFLSHREAFPRAMAAVLAAIEIDSSFAEARASLAFIRFVDWDWAGAEREFNHALELNPKSVTVRELYSYYLAHMGRLDEAIRQAQHALEVEPLSLLPNSDLAYFHNLAGRYDDAIHHATMARELDTSFMAPHWNLAWAYWKQSRLEEAIHGFRTTYTLTRGENPLITADLAHACAEGGRRDEALELLDELGVLSTQRYVSSAAIAWIHLGLGQKEQALERLEAAFDEHDFVLTGLKVGLRFDDLHDDTRFQDIVRRMNFPEDRS